MFFCGAKSLPNDPNHLPTSPSSPAGKARPSRNPYSTVGLDKFAAVVAELKSLKQTIADDSGNSSIRFTFSDSHWIPVILHKNPQSIKKIENPRYPEELRSRATATAVGKGRRRPKGRCNWRRFWPRWYWLLAAVVILACLALSGRTLAICCLSAFWFLAGRFRRGGGPEPKKGSYLYMRRKSL